MTHQTTIPFIGGIKDGHRVTPDEYPQPWVRCVERPEIDYATWEGAFDPETPAAYTVHTYELKGVHPGARFYIPLDSDPGAALAAAIDKYPPPADPEMITVPVKMLYDALRQIGDPVPDLTLFRKLYSLVCEHYRNNPDQP